MAVSPDTNILETSKPIKVGTYINNQYFSGAQASVFIGSVWIDDLVNINYQVQHTRQPIYGYGSQHFNLMPKGTILVAGDFTLNFREPNYLWLVLQHWVKFNKNNLRASLSDKKDQEKDLIEDAATQLSYAGDRRQMYDTFFGQRDPETGKEIAERALQKQSKIFTKAANKTTDTNFNHPSFDITIGYGFDLNENSPGERIYSIHIMGKAKTIMADGKPIQEQYQFIARNIS